MCDPPSYARTGFEDGHTNKRLQSSEKGLARRWDDAHGRSLHAHTAGYQSLEPTASEGPENNAPILTELESHHKPVDGTGKQLINLLLMAKKIVWQLAEDFK